MAQRLLKSYGIVFILFGVFLICCSPLVSYSLSEASLLTELAIGLALVWFGARLIAMSRKQSEKYPGEVDDEEKSGEEVYMESAPFYYELEPVFVRELPPIPKDIGREYDPVIIDKV